MNVVAENLAKKFSNTWLFKNLNITFRSGQCVAVTGGNGSGKTTLLKILAGYTSPSKGAVSLLHNDRTISKEIYYKNISIAAPYMELVEEFTLIEMIRFHSQFSSSVLSIEEILTLSGLESSKNKPIHQFSSGMKQKLKLTLALTTTKPVLLLDEPTSNLDKKNKDWYKEALTAYSKNKTTIIFSNQKEEYDFLTKEVFSMEDYKE